MDILEERRRQTRYLLGKRRQIGSYEKKALRLDLLWKEGSRLDFIGE